MITGSDTAEFPVLDFRNPSIFWKTVQEIKDFFKRNAADIEPVIKKGIQFHQAYVIMDPFIQEYTAKTCPYCGTVCCCNKHGFPEFADIVAIIAMNGKIPQYDLSVDPNALCQFIGEKGCILPRAERPYRCTWYFCEPLLLQIELDTARKYREFIRNYQYMGHARAELINTFHELWLSGQKALKP